MVLDPVSIDTLTATMQTCLGDTTTPDGFKIAWRVLERLTDLFYDILKS